MYSIKYYTRRQLSPSMLTLNHGQKKQPFSGSQPRARRAKNEALAAFKGVWNASQAQAHRPEFATLLYVEELFRHIDNRRQLAAYAGFAPTPWQSGSIRQEQGASKAGNSRLRTTMVELSWLWIRYQPDSALARWFQERVQHNGGRMRAG